MMHLRQFSRAEVNIPIEAIIVGYRQKPIHQPIGKKLSAYIANLGGGGLLIKSDILLPATTVLSLSFNLREHPINCLVEIIWVTRYRDGIHMGCKFSNLSPEEQQYIIDFVTEVMAKSHN